MHTLLLGGARSGKSTLAVQMAERQPLPVVYVATAQPFDDDLARRVARHREERPPHWTTVEEPVALAAAVDAQPDDVFVVIDCLTVWLGNLFARDLDGVEGEALDRLVEGGLTGVTADVRALHEALRRRTGPTVVVSNEVGMGVHPETAVGRVYRDELGRLNQLVASTARTTLLLVAGRALPLHDPWDLLQ